MSSSGYISEGPVIASTSEMSVASESRGEISYIENLQSLSRAQSP